MLLRRSSFNDLFREVNRLQGECGRAFSHRVMHPAAGTYGPPMSIWEDENSVYVEMDAPGVDSAKLDVSIMDGNQLTIQGERPAIEVEGAVWHRKERYFGKFARAVELPSMVDVEKVEAKYDSGVLKLTMPKADTAKPRKIVVK